MSEDQVFSWEKALAERPKSTIAQASPQEFAQAFDAYLEMQKIIDERMPDAIMKIQGKLFRKKAYWRAVATAFKVDVEVIEDEFFEDNGDWGYRVTCMATIGDRHSAGDGTCMASEKPGKGQATHHNVRGHAHTRAFNRAVSNLVGFGEVSAEEINREAPATRPAPRQNAPQKPSQGSGGVWDGTKEVFFGKYSKETPPKKWADVPSKYLDWVIENMKDPARGMASQELGRRAKLEAEGGDVVDAEVVDERNPPPEEGELFP
jgi:hypothetical protein